MGEQIEFNRDEMIEEKMREILRDIRGSLTPRFPKLDYAPMALYDEGEYTGRPLLFINHRSYYFISYFVEQSNPDDIVLGVARKRSGNGWAYISRIENFTRLIYSLSLSDKRSCSVQSAMPGFLGELPEGSFLKIDSAEDVQHLGLYQGYESGKLRLAFAFDSDSNDYEDLSEVEFQKRDMGEEVRPGTMKTEFELRRCRSISLMQLGDGISSIEGIPDPNGSRGAKTVLKKLMDRLLSGPFSSMNIEFDRYRMRTSYASGDKTIEASCYSSFTADSLLSSVKMLARLDQAEGQESQEGRFIYESGDLRRPVEILIDYPETGSYRIRIAKSSELQPDWGLE